MRMPEAFRLRVPIRLFTADTEIRGHLSPGEERITDILQRGDPFRILPQGAQPDSEHWIEIRPDEILFVVPPTRVSPPERRQARQAREVFVRAGPYEVTGTAHLVPGSEADLVSRSSHPFLPLTDATVTAPDREPEALDVVIVNLRLTSEYRVA
jgi:hypothetical protein